MQQVTSPYDEIARLVGEEKAAEILEALRSAGFTVTRDVDRLFSTWQSDH